MAKSRNTKAAKAELFARYGTYCWLCRRKFDKKKLTGHHVVPFRICNCTKTDNIFLACEHCHFDVINKIPYPSKEYDELMEQMRSFRDSLRRE